jgi:transposase
VALSLTPGQAHDITQAVPLLDQVEPEAFLADKGYDSDALVATLEARGITPVIPSKANRREPRATDFALYRERNLVERFFCKLKQYRAISTRYDKLANTFLAAVALVCVLFWLMCGRRPRCKRILTFGLRSGASHVSGLFARCHDRWP